MKVAIVWRGGFVHSTVATILQVMIVMIRL